MPLFTSTPRATDTEVTESPLPVLPSWALTLRPGPKVWGLTAGLLVLALWTLVVLRATVVAPPLSKQERPRTQLGSENL